MIRKLVAKLDILGGITVVDISVKIAKSNKNKNNPANKYKCPVTALGLRTSR